MLWTPGAMAPYCLVLLKKLDCQHSSDGRLFETRYEVVPCMSSDVINNNQHILRKKDCEGVVMQWSNPLTLQPEQSDGQGSIPDRFPQLEDHDNGS